MLDAPALWTVRGLVLAVQRNLEREFPDVRVEGEVSNCRAGQSGHVYLTLREGDAQISVVMFRTRARLLPFKLEDGLHILLRGKITVYESRGQLQMIAESAEPVGDGARRLAFEQLKKKLAAEGLFDAERKRPLPAFPRCIGVVTSAQGAVIHDMWRILTRRYTGSRVLLFPAAVQGANAASELCAGLRWFASHPQEVDVVVVARGGGSLEDLDAFNDEQLARAIALSPVPVVSAVGHETDFTIADFVADVRAPTPSAAAELITAQQHQVAERSAVLATRLQRACRYRVSMARERLSRSLASSALAAARELTFRRQQRLDDLLHRAVEAQRGRLREVRAMLQGQAMRLAARDVAQRLGRERPRMEQASTGLRRALQQKLAGAEARLRNASARLTALSPQAVLQRGYALVYVADGSLLRSARQALPGDALVTRIADGAVTSRVLSSEAASG